MSSKILLIVLFLITPSSLVLSFSRMTTRSLHLHSNYLSYVHSGHVLRLSSEDINKDLKAEEFDDDDDDDDSAGKGFGTLKAAPAPQTKKGKKRENVVVPMPVMKSSSMQSTSQPSNEISGELVDIDAAIKSSQVYQSTTSRQELELQEKIDKLREEEELLAQDASVGAVPEIVANRMIGRIAAFFGIPVFGGLAIFVGAYFYGKSTDTVIQPSVIAYATQAPFVLGLIGITYGIMSASWEPENDGSLLGIDEFKINLQRVRDGLKRTSETAALKDDIETSKQRLNKRK